MEVKFQKPTTINILYTILILFTLCFFMYILTISQQCSPKTTAIQHIPFTGRYKTTSVNWTYDIDADYHIEPRNISDITFHLRFKKEILKGVQVNFLADKITAKIFLNGELIDTYGGENSHPSIVKSTGKEWSHFISPGITPKDEITIQLKSCYSTFSKSYLNDFLGNICQGSYYDLIKYLLIRDLIPIIGAVIVLIMGLALTTVAIALKAMKSPIAFNNVSCGLFMISSALAIMFNMDFITLVFENGFLVNIISFTNLLLILQFLIAYMKTYFDNKFLEQGMNIFTYIWAGVILTFIFGQTTGVTDYVDFGNFIIAPGIMILGFMILFLFINFRQKKGLSSAIRIISGLMLCISAIIELLHKSITDTYAGFVFEISMIIYSTIQFISIMTVAKKNFVQAAKSKKMENELLQSKISVMLSQIQPHFLYNTLVVIRQLCDINPKTAKQAVTEFATYLRGNLDSLTLNNTIPFEKEMEHVENYISLEKKRFGYRINVEYEIEVTDFEVPSLTIQTVVENAIRHGITKRREGGTVTISTREYGNNYIIEIHDNGIGMDTTIPMEKDDNRSHIGIENVRSRIESMCKGSLIFNSTPNIGTTVYMTIPKTKKKFNYDFEN